MFARLRKLFQRREPQSLGDRGEAAAARFLRRLGYVIVARGERDRWGELDIVAVDHRVVVFVEVKTRRAHDDHPAKAVDFPKQQRLTRTAMAFLKRHDLLEYAARFDIVTVTWPANVRRPTIEHFPNAFEPTGKGQLFS